MDAITAFPTFVLSNVGWTFNFVFSQALFWGYGFPALSDHGYDDAEKSPASFGGIPSGPSGSGVAIISTMLMVVGALAWSSAFLAFKKVS
ncbi:hypothetical protein TrLO_g2380 [Triparma laevis f. longispina]|uniref:Uncharacterized protein n=1 Tax=Triparma laevis f. longispina TaxID=1714387 RepID=A0A9W7AQV9_9STRA|nr:hypothetical protein TrLO_g2380 [Triparma laevis f. longispina]